jgi:hypothetical protein
MARPLAVTLLSALAAVQLCALVVQAGWRQLRAVFSWPALVLYPGTAVCDGCGREALLADISFTESMSGYSLCNDCDRDPPLDRQPEHNVRRVSVARDDIRSRAVGAALRRGHD